MREKQWAVVPLLDDTAPTLWFSTRTEAEDMASGKPYSIQYRPGRKPKVKPKQVKVTER
jgi:hypothetical protein